MKITIDTDRKVVEVDYAVNLKELVTGLKSFLGDEWKEYSIEAKANYCTYPYYTRILSI